MEDDRNYGGNFRGRGNRNNRDYGSERYGRNQGSYDGGRGGGDRRQFTPRVQQTAFDPDVEMHAQLRLLLISVGDFHSRTPNSSPLSLNIKGLATVLEADLDAHCPKILGLVSACIQDLPMQSGVYAALTALINQRKPGFARQLLAKILASLRQNLANCHQGALPFTRAKLSIRFLAELVNCKVLALFGAGGFAQLLQDLERIVADASTRQATRDAVALLIATALIWALPSLSAIWPEGLQSMLSTMTEHMKTREPIFGVTGLRPVFLFEHEDEDPDKMTDVEKSSAEPTTDTLALLWKVLTDMMKVLDALPKDADKANTHLSPVIVQPWRDLKLELEQEASVHNMVNWEPPVLPAVRNPVSIAFTLFDNKSGNDAATMFHLPENDRILLADYLRDIAVTFCPFIKADGTRIGHIKTVADQMISLSKLVPPDSHLEYLVVETVFQLLLQPPHTQSAYVHRIMLDLLRSAPTIMPASMASGMELLFRSLPRMDFIVAKELATWFAHNLSNTGFSWPYWNYWDFVLALPPDDAQRVFVSTVLETCVKLTFHDRIKGVIPESFHILLPPIPAIHSRYLHSENTEEVGVSPATRQVAEKLQEMVVAKEENDIVQEFLLGTEHSGIDPEIDGQGWKASVFMHVLLTAGEATIAHTRSLMDRYMETLLLLASQHEHQIAIVEATAEVWESSNQMFLFVMEELMMRTLVSPIIVVVWVFSDECLDGFAAAPFLWDVLCRATTISIDRVKFAAQAVAAAQQGIPEIEEMDDEADETKGDTEAISKVDVPKRLEILAQNLREAQEVTLHLVQRFVQVIGQYVPTVPQEDLKKDPWFLAMLSYFRAVCRLYLQAPSSSIEPSEVLSQMLDPQVVMQVFEGSEIDEYSRNILEQLKNARALWAQ